MRELAGFYERAKLDNLLRHLLWNDDPRDAAIDDFEKMLEDSFETFYGRLRRFLQSSDGRTTACLKR